MKGGALRAYTLVYLVFLYAPILLLPLFAFNDSLFPSLPWEGFTWAWFFGDARPMIGVFHDS